jgi:hypothetical protein
MKLVDDRTPEQKQSHPVIVAGTDSFMSGWGEAVCGTSYAGWACRLEDAERVKAWVRKRGDIKRVRVVGNDWKPAGVGHCHIYVVDDNHPALA